MQIFKHKNTYLGRSLSRNHLCRYNHRIVCSSISQQHCYPELGMISTKNKGTLEDSHIAKDIAKLIQANKVGFIRLQRSWKSWNIKLVNSNTEIWTPALDRAWLLKNLHTQHKESFPSLLHSLSDYSFHSSVVQGVQRRKPTPLDLFVRFLLTLGWSS